ncbi:benzyl alcohol O-benzoyltransferase-like [Humulus lupulus]|uniref:benzyl alcohol O-benzoyltransferase-like n=1 Tax=Humulus lupulus TaxID=3486 RepID=UPI002B40754B|nr:benzyl alcohol O-benzoyltransferase-like [Humulus lupulus]
MEKTLNFQVQMSAPEIIQPEKLGPRETKYLSNIDDQIGLRNHIPFVQFYLPSKAMQGHDPAVLIKLALSKALVYYYPMAGRLRNSDNGKLVVDCNGEGVIFREADADVKLAELREVDGGLRPPFPQFDKLLFDDIWGSNSISDSPLLRIQVTRLACGGFVLAYTFNHCICDAYGAFMFMQVVSEFCRIPNRTSPSSLPSWGRELLKPRSPPIISYPHSEYDSSPHSPNITFTETQFKQFAQTSVFLSRTDILLLKSQIPDQKLPTFDAVAACLWRARTRTLLSPKSTTRLLFPIDTRFRYKPLLPNGYYGSAVVFPCAITEAAKLIEKPLPYAASLISAVKQGVTGDEYRASVLDFIEANEHRGFCAEGAFVVSDMTRLRFTDVDFGWGQAVYGGPARAGTGLVPIMVTSLITHKNDKGVEGVLALVSLPLELMERFHKEIRKEINNFVPSSFISSAL